MAASIKRAHDRNDVSNGANKKCRVDNCLSRTGYIHANFTTKLLKDVAVEIRSISDEDCFSFVRFSPLAILNSNAVDGSSSSSAYYRIGEHEEQYSFASLISKGLNMLMNYLDVQEMPSNAQDCLVLDTILHFLITMTDEGAQVPTENLKGLAETDIPIILTNHLFTKLETSSYFLINSHCKEEMKGNQKSLCPCSRAVCQMTGHFGDTSIGNGQVWHGNLDIIVNDQVVIGIPKEPDPYSPGMTATEIKRKQLCLTRNAQIIAETIVFSFLQKKRHPEYSQHLSLYIGITGKEMVVYIYDAKNDLLLESSSIPLYVRNITLVGRINLTAISVSWLVINHRYLCTDLPENLKTKKAKFFDTAGSKLSVYQDGLQFGNVEKLCHSLVKPSFNLVHDPNVKKLEEDCYVVLMKELKVFKKRLRFDSWS